MYADKKRQNGGPLLYAACKTPQVVKRLEIEGVDVIPFLTYFQKVEAVLLQQAQDQQILQQ